MEPLTVFVTRTGGKYHATDNCPTFADSQAVNGTEVIAWLERLRDRTDLTPCTKCWQLTGEWDQWTQLAHRVELAGGEPMERVAVQQVLRHVPGLAASNVSPQVAALGASGARYILDFAIRGQGDDRVAVEVDGYDKAPGRKTPEQIRRELEARRADLIQAGWAAVVNLSNERVATRASECITEVEAAVRPALRARPASAPPLPSPSVGGAPSTPAASVSSPGQSRAVLAVAAAAFVVVAGAVAWAVLGDEGSGTERGSDSGVQPVGTECPSDAPIKGNVSDTGEKIWHEPGWTYYSRTTPEECFADPQDAAEAGYRASEVK